MDWVPIDCREAFNKRRPFLEKKGDGKSIESEFPTGKESGIFIRP
jgi:hypothetical protein